MKTVRLMLAVALAVIVLPPLVVPVFVPWSAINCEEQDINIQTGQARYSRRLWFVRISERVEDTAISRALDGETVKVADAEAWHRVNTFSPGGGYSPHYRYHGALHQVGEFRSLQQVYGLDKTDAARLAREVLARWQTSGSDFAGGSLLEAKMVELHEAGAAAAAVGAQR
jgi:hypothetical protein